MDNKDEIEKLKEENERLKDIAVSIAALLPLDRFTLHELSNLITSVDKETEMYIELLPLYFI